MKILLVYPEFPDTFWSFKHALRFIKRKAALPPLGLVTIAAMLPETWSRRLVDVNVSRLSDADIDWADLVLISAMTVQRDSARQIIHRCRKAGRTVVAGGPLFTGESEDFEEVDHLVLNEAELTLPEFLRDFEAGKAQRVYSTDRFPDLDETPVPEWQLLDLESYASMAIQFSRGCPYNCDFCNVTALFGRRPRIKTSAQIIRELDSLQAAGWHGNVFFVDDNFIGNKRYLKEELLPALIDWQNDRGGISFFTEVSVNLADDDELMHLMAEAGFDTVFTGIETPSDESLTECSKKQNVNRDLVEDVRKIQRAGFQVQGGFIVGFDSDTPSIFERQIDFIQKSGIVTAMVGLLQAPPGTALWDRMKKEGRLLGKLSGDNVDGSTNIVPRMSLETLLEGYRRILEHIYSPEHYYRRVRTFLEEYRPRKAAGRPNLGGMGAFLRSVVKLGILGRERFHYWNLLAWTLWRRPHLLRMAVTMAIYGYHFRRICEIQTL